MRCVLPYCADLADAAAELETLYAYPQDRPWLRANMVASVDGAATADGRSEGLSGKADRQIFFLLRGLADVVVVGATTVRREGYGPARARPEYAELRAAAGQAPAPVIAVVSRSLDLDFGSQLFTAGDQRPMVITAAGAPAEALARARGVADVIVAGDEIVDLPGALRTLAERGLIRQLTEGGPHLLGQLATAGCLDELCVTVSPLLIGSDVALRIVAGSHLDPAVSLSIGHLLEEDGFLFARYLIGPVTPGLE